MTRLRTHSMDPFVSLRRAVDRLFEDFPFDFDSWWLSAPAFPALNVWEDEGNVYVEAELPGVNSEDVEVYAVGRELTIKGRRPATDDDQLTYHRRERGTGEFTRVLTLPVDVDTENVQASLQDGVLTVTLPKAAQAKARKIVVKAD